MLLVFYEDERMGQREVANVESHRTVMRCYFKNVASDDIGLNAYLFGVI